MSRHLASLVGEEHEATDVRIYLVDEPWGEAEWFYWCCQEDGACGKHLPSIEAAVEEATIHVTYYHREEHYGHGNRGERQAGSEQAASAEDSGDGC